MRVRLFIEAEVDDQAVINAIGSGTAAERVLAEIPASLSRTAERILSQVQGVSEVKSIYIPRMIGL